jgi:hypothetical protein
MCEWLLASQFTHLLPAAVNVLLGATPGHISPDVAIESYTMNITTVSGFDQVKASMLLVIPPFLSVTTHSLAACRGQR